MVRRKRKQKSIVHKLQDKAERLWKEYCFLRDGRECQVMKYFPQIPLDHSEVLQIDHCFSRKNKALFLDVANGTVVCSSCNAAKAWNLKSICRAIDEIVIKREGQDVFDRMKEQDMMKSGNADWGNVIWLENKIMVLEQMIKDLRQVRGNLPFSGDRV